MWPPSLPKLMNAGRQRRPPAGPARRKGPARRLAVECLEDRTLPSTLQLVSPANALLPASDSAGGVAQPMTSADGRFTAYTSTAPNLVPGQVNTAVASNVFLYDQQSGTTTLVSHTPGSPATGANGNSAAARISGDGRLVVYESQATNLATGQAVPPELDNVFLYDRTSGHNTLLSHRFDSATSSGNNDSITSFTTGFGFSANTGRFLLFSSSATDLVAGQNGPAYENLFLYDTVAGTTTLVSHNLASSLTGCNSDAENADLTSDGSTIVFESFASDVVAGQTGAIDNIFLYQTATGSSRLVSGVFNGSGNSSTHAAGFSSQPSLSADGGLLAYVSDATLLVANQTPSNGAFQPLNVFSYNTHTGTTSLVSGANGSPSETGDFSSSEAFVSSNGSAIAFLSGADNLIAGQGVATGNVFLYNTSTGGLTLVSHVNNAPGTAAGGVDASVSKTFDDLSVSGDGRRVAYRSTAGNVAAGQSGPSGIDNVFVYDGRSGQNTLASHVGGSPTSVGNQNSDLSRISLDGVTVAFLSVATNLSPGSTIASGGENLFLFRVPTDADPALVSRSAFRANATSLVYGASGDGRFVVFTSNAPNVVPNQVDPNFDQDVFVLDRNTGATTLVSHVVGQPSTTGDLGSPTTAGVVDSGNAPAISTDGNFVAFVSRATNLVAGQNQFRQVDQVFLFNRLTGTVTLLSHHYADPSAAGNGASDHPVLSADGRYVAFHSDAPDLIQGLIEPTTGGLVANVFLYDTVSGTTALVSHAAGEVLLSADGGSGSPVLSDDGRFVAYFSLASNLVAGATIAPTYNVYLFDRSTGNNTLVSHSAASPTVSPAERSRAPVLSADGNFVAFASFATNLVAGQSAGMADTTNVFLYNRQTGALTLVSGANGSASVTANNYSDSPALNQDGTFVAFRSSATNLVAGQAGPAGSNIFLFSRQPGTPPLTLVSHATGSGTTAAAGDSTVPVIDGDGALVAYLSSATNLVPGQSGGGVNNVFGWSRTLQTTFLTSGIDGSPTTVSPGPAFLPIISRDPIVLFTVTGSLTAGAGGTINGYGNTLIDITLTPTAFADGSPAGTVVGTLSTISVLVGQVSLPVFSLPAGAAADNSHFLPGSTQLDGTASLATYQFVVSVASQSSFTILVQADTALGLVRRAFTLAAQGGGGGGQPVPAHLLDVAVALTTSAEYLSNIIVIAYQRYLGRGPDAGGQAYWLAHLEAGLTDERLEAGFIGSAEYIANHGGTGEAWVVGMYRDLLGRDPDAGGLSFWLAQVHGGTPPAVIAYGFAASAEREGQRVTADYQRYLGRTPGPPEVGYWVDQFANHGMTNEHVVAGFIAALEYYQDHQGDPRDWLFAAYQYALGRPPDPAGLDHWLAVLQGP